jgi:hypothetical protein
VVRRRTGNEFQRLRKQKSRPWRRCFARLLPHPDTTPAPPLRIWSGTSLVRSRATVGAFEARLRSHKRTTLLMYPSSRASRGSRGLSRAAFTRRCGGHSPGRVCPAERVVRRRGNGRNPERKDTYFSFAVSGVRTSASASAAGEPHNVRAGTFRETTVPALMTAPRPIRTLPRITQ